MLLPRERDKPELSKAARKVRGPRVGNLPSDMKGSAKATWAWGQDGQVCPKGLRKLAVGQPAQQAHAYKPEPSAKQPSEG